MLFPTVKMRSARPRVLEATRLQLQAMEGSGALDRHERALTYCSALRPFICFSTKNAGALGCHGKEIWGFPTSHCSGSCDPTWLHLRNSWRVSSLLSSNDPFTQFFLDKDLHTIPKTQIAENQKSVTHWGVKLDLIIFDSKAWQEPT